MSDFIGGLLVFLGSIFNTNKKYFVI